MTIPTRFLCRVFERTTATREPDFIIGGADSPYLKRWHIIPRNRFFNIYLHEMWRSDDERALHDHPWWWMNIMLRSYYMEQTEREFKRWSTGSVRIRKATTKHQLVMPLTSRTVFRPLTLFITGPKIREWGFHCPQGWRHWREFTSPKDSGVIGRGCE